MLSLPAVSAGPKGHMPSSPRGPSCRWRIVATDDDPELLNFVVLTLREAGHCVFAAYDGDSACELALYLPQLDLLITNTRLATLTAGQLIRRVREMKPTLPILHLGNPLTENGPLGSVPGLREPFSSAQLLSAVEAIVLNRRGPKDPPAS